jgi:hypothetical protein
MALRAAGARSVDVVQQRHAERAAAAREREKERERERESTRECQVGP